jgi:radical SAM protein (TIGR01212 family)
MYPWGDDRPFNSYAGYFRRTFGGRVQKVAVNAGFTCPNRDGTVGTGGCTFCNNGAFTPSYCQPSKSVTQQIEEGIEFHRNRYRTASRYLAYFQSFSNTYAPLDHLRLLYDEALAHPEVAGIVVGTRPDCVDEQKLDYFAELAHERGKYVAIEYGIESVNDRTLKLINRGHDFATARRAVEMSAERGLHVGAHFILGLPGESDQELIEQTEIINSLPLTTVKFHQLQVFAGTAMAEQYDRDPSVFRFWEVEEYIDLFIEILRRLRPDIVVERFASEAPPRYHYGRNWGLIRNETLLAMLESRLRSRGAYQGEALTL